MTKHYSIVVTSNGNIYRNSIPVTLDLLNKSERSVVDCHYSLSRILSEQMYTYTGETRSIGNKVGFTVNSLLTELEANKKFWSSCQSFAQKTNGNLTLAGQFECKSEGCIHVGEQVQQRFISWTLDKFPTHEQLKTWNLGLSKVFKSATETFWNV